MAYVGTARRIGTDRDSLASIIAGEAGREGLRGMRAVASVIQNRAQRNFSGYGADPVSQATARRQFQGQAAPTKAAYKVADELLSGQLQDVTGGAVYYANPGASTAKWATRLDTSNSLKIGNHYFTDNAKGIPFAGNGGIDPNPAPGYSEGGAVQQVAFQVNPPTGKLTWANSAEELSVADENMDGDVTVGELKRYNNLIDAPGAYQLNDDGVYAWSGNPANDPAYLKAKATDDAMKTAGNINAAERGEASSIPKAIVTAGDQQAKSLSNALKNIAAGAAAANQATIAANAQSDATIMGWLGNRLLQVVVFILAFIFVLIGLYMFANKTTIAVPGLSQ